MNYTSEYLMHSSSDNGFATMVEQTELPLEALILEPMPLEMLPPEPEITDEDFEKEVDLMMMDSDSMDAEPSGAHDLVSLIIFSSSFLPL